jgi:hypothetical protein
MSRTPNPPPSPQTLHYNLLPTGAQGLFRSLCITQESSNEFYRTTLSSDITSAETWEAWVRSSARRMIVLTIFGASLSPLRRKWGLDSKIDRGRFLLHPFQFFIEIGTAKSFRQSYCSYNAETENSWRTYDVTRGQMKWFMNIPPAVGLCIHLSVNMIFASIPPIYLWFCMSVKPCLSR